MEASVCIIKISCTSTKLDFKYIFRSYFFWGAGGASLFTLSTCTVRNSPLQTAQTSALCSFFFIRRRDVFADLWLRKRCCQRVCREVSENFSVICPPSPFPTAGLMQMYGVTDREAISRAIPDQQPKGLVLQSGKVTPLNDTFYSGELRLH